MRLKSDAYAGNITRRGKTPKSAKKAASTYPVGPILLGFLIFVVVGSAIFQIFKSNLF